MVKNKWFSPEMLRGGRKGRGQVSDRSALLGRLPRVGTELREPEHVACN